MKLYEVAITDKLTGEVVDGFNDVEEVERTENLITGETVTYITRKGNRTFKYKNSTYDITIFNK